MAIKTEITDNTPLWWEIQNIPTEIIRELRRRSNTNNIGMNMPQPLTDVTFDFENSYKNYKGPMTPWVRIFSNSTGKSINGMVPRSLYLDKNNQQVDYDGFVLKGGEGFYEAYGYTPGKNLGEAGTNVPIIGYQANGQPHYIDNIYRSEYSYQTSQNNKFPQNNQTSPILPPPAITSVSVKQSKEYLTYGKFSFKCFGLAQLEYLTPFFLTAGINVFIEFGWNLFNQKSLINLSKIEECWKLVRYPQTALDRSMMSNGNYGCITGIITKYQFSTDDGFVYKCDVETISRQGLYAGMKTDNNAKIQIENKKELSDFMDLRTFIRLYLPLINDVLKQPRDNPGPTNPANFLNYIIARSKVSPPTVKGEKDAKANEEQLKTSKINIQKILKEIQNTNSQFYDGKSEDRVFTGRLQDVYLKSKSPNEKSEVINYGSVNGSQQISFADDKLDFDAKDGSSEVWLQLGFVFEMINLFMSNTKRKLFFIDIDDVVVNAHPNLISCDKNVLIPNAIAPKVNMGIIARPSVPGKGGFLKLKEGQTLTKLSEENPFFLNQKPDIKEKPNLVLDKKLAENTIDYSNISDQDSLYLAYESARKTFKTDGLIRDDLDVIINYLYYNINKRNSNDPKESAAFPAKNSIVVKRKTKDGKTFDVSYKANYYGYLKHIYISKEKLISIVNSEETKGYKQFINAILNVVNESVDNFWKFEIQEAVDNKGNSILSISDKNTINFEALKEIYTFELAKTNNVIRNVNFDVSLSNEQSVNVQFGGPNTGNLTEELRKGLSTGQTTLNLIDNTPPLKFTDRLDQFELRQLAKELGETKDNSLAPGTSSGLNEDNSDITDLQKYGDKSKSGVLMITVKNVTNSDLLKISSPTTTRQVNIAGNMGGLGTITSYQKTIVETSGYESNNIKELSDDNKNPKNYKMLCLPPTLKNKLRQMLDDNDYKNNIAKYSGVADNFTLTLTFDGIFALRNLQCFAISNLPKPYVPGNVVFQVLEVEHTIEGGSWKTVVTALVRCIGGSKLDYIIV